MAPKEVTVKLDLGCGPSKRDGSIGIDKLRLKGVDIIADLEDGLKFIKDDSVDIIYSNSFLEHVRNFENLMEEIHRVIKPSGRIEIFVPHFSNPFHYSDYTHVRTFGLYTFYYFVPEEYQLERVGPNYRRDVQFRVISQRLVFASWNRKRNRFKRILGPIFNKSTKRQELYEECFSWIFPCHGIEIVLEPIKSD